MREAFKCCGKIQSVLVARDPVSLKGKGFGFVTFKLPFSVNCALNKTSFKIRNREIIIKRYSPSISNKV